MSHPSDSVDSAGPSTAEIRSRLPLDHPQTGNRLTGLRQYGDSTIEFEAEIAPGETEAPQIEFAHIHPSQRQRVTVIDGVLRGVVGGAANGEHTDAADPSTDRLTLRTAAVVDVPPRTPHRFWNDSDRPTRVQVAVCPGHGFDRFLYDQYVKRRSESDSAPEWHGDVIENTMTGERIRFRKRAVDTEGRLLQYDLLLPPGTRTLDFHASGIIHPRQTKHVSVRAGLLLARNYDDGLLQRLAINDTVLYVPYLFGAGGGAKLAVKGARFAMDQRRRMLVPALAVLPGEEIVIRPGVAHQLWNPGPETTLLRVDLQPALRFEQLLEMLYGLASDGLVFDNGTPMSYRQWHLLSETYKPELQLAKSKTLRAVVTNISTFVGRSQGYVAWDPAYSPAPNRSAAAGEFVDTEPLEE